MKKILNILAVFVVFSACHYVEIKERIVINMNEKGATVAASMYGLFFEEISNAGDGGFYAELVKNRSFEELEMPEGYHAEGVHLIPKPVKNHITGQIERQTFNWTTDPVPGWTLEAESSAAEMKLSKENFYFSTAPNNLKLVIKNTSNRIRLINSGYWGMGITKDETYHLRILLRPVNGYKGSVVAKLISEKGEILASADLGELKNKQWNDIRKDMVSKGAVSKKIHPEESEFSRFGRRFEYGFSPFSYTIFRIKATPNKL